MWREFENPRITFPIFEPYEEWTPDVIGPPGGVPRITFPIFIHLLLSFIPGANLQ